MYACRHAILLQLAGGRHGPLLDLKNARYVLVNCYVFSFFFCEPYGSKAINTQSTQGGEEVHIDNSEPWSDDVIECLSAS